MAEGEKWLQRLTIRIVIYTGVCPSKSFAVWELLKISAIDINCQWNKLISKLLLWGTRNWNYCSPDKDQRKKKKCSAENQIVLKGAIKYMMPLILFSQLCCELFCVCNSIKLYAHMTESIDKWIYRHTHLYSNTYLVCVLFLIPSMIPSFLTFLSVYFLTDTFLFFSFELFVDSDFSENFPGNIEKDS